MAIAYDDFREESSRERIITTANGFANRRDSNVTSGKNAFIAGYVTVSGDIRLGVVFSEGGNIRFRRCSTEVCDGF